MKTVSTIFFFVAATCIAAGLYHLLFYQAPDADLLQQGRNAYVGGDAFNYIINASQATAYFVLALCFMVPGMFILKRSVKKEIDKAINTVVGG